MNNSITNEAIEKYLKRNMYLYGEDSGYSYKWTRVGPNKIDIDNFITLPHDTTIPPPFKLGTVNEQFIIGGTDLGYDSFPEQCGTMSITDCSNIRSLSGIHKHIDRIEGELYIEDTKSGGVLCLLLMECPPSRIWFDMIMDYDTEFEVLYDIIHPKLDLIRQDPKSTRFRRDLVIQAQQELIRAGYKKQAML